MPIVAGSRLTREQTLELASRLSRDGFDRTERMLLEALTNGQEFVALSDEDREAMLAVLDHPPPELAELRGVLFADLNWRRGYGHSGRRVRGVRRSLFDRVRR